MPCSRMWGVGSSDDEGPVTERCQRRLRVSSDALMAEAMELIELLSPLELDSADHLTVIDIRDTADRAAEGWIPGSLAVPRTVLEWRADPRAEQPDRRVHDAAGPLVIVCNDGYSSLLAAASLHRMGYDDVGHLVGGHRAWVAAGLPVDFG